MNKKTSILVVDDDPTILQIYSQILRTDGYEVWEAATGQRGLQAARERRPDLVLLDVMLPDLSGLEVCRQIKADPALRDVFVVLLSGVAASVASKVDGLGTGADEYLVKPLAADELLARLGTIVRLRNATAALRNQARFLQTFMDAISSPIFRKDAGGRYSGCNQAFEQYLGLAREQIIGKTVYDVAPKELAEVYHQADRALLERPGRQTYERSVLAADGTRRSVILDKTTFQDAEGEAPGIVGIIIDITERKQAEEQIQLLADAVHSTQELISITDQESRFTFVNQAFLQAYGYTAGEVLGRTPDFLYSASNPPGLRDVVSQQTLGGGWSGEVVNRRKDGTEFTISLHTSLIKNSEGRTLGRLGVARDISERLRAEKRRAAFARLGYGLSAVNTQEQAADLILEVGSEFFGWDAGYLNLYSATEDKIIPVRSVETVGGERVWSAHASSPLEPSPMMRWVLEGGAELTDGTEDSPAAVKLVPLGNTPRRTASGMFVPIHAGGAAIGVLSLQSYTPRAYSSEDLKLLQTLADLCGGALRRIEITNALREKEASYRRLVENTPEGIFQTMFDDRFRSANPALAQMFGYATPEELMAKVTHVGRQLYVRPETRRKFKRLLETTGSVRGFEAEVYRKDGSIIWVVISAQVVRDASGAPRYYEGIARDITERKWVEDLLRRQCEFGLFLSGTEDSGAVAEQLLRIALENINLDCGAVYLVNPQTKALELAAHRGLSAGFAKRAARFAADPAGDRLTGAGPAASPGQVGPMAAVVRQLKRESLLALEVVPIQHSGEVVAVLNVGSRKHAAIPAKTRQALEALAGQAGGAITRIRAEQALRTSQQILEKAFQGLHAAVFVLDSQAAAIQECNPAATRMFGYSREEMIGQSPALLHLDEARHKEFIRQMQAAVKEKGFLNELEFTMKRKDGATLSAKHYRVPVRNRAGEIVNWVSVIRDITEHKEIEAGLRRLSQHIIEAQEAERQRVARDLHDSVNQIIASANMRLRKVGESALLNPAARELLVRCEQLLTEALEENRRIVRNLRPIELEELGLAQTCRSFCKQFEARTHLQVKCRIPREDWCCPPAAELHLFRIVQEALHNVAKHARAKVVRLEIAHRGNSTRLSIKDDGCGFNPHAVQRVRWAGEGTGLANMRERAAILGGTCEVVSAPNRGTTITVRVCCQDRRPTDH
jgi:PAS domain S-box-containing protein